MLMKGVIRDACRGRVPTFFPPTYRHSPRFRRQLSEIEPWIERISLVCRRIVMDWLTLELEGCGSATAARILVRPEAVAEKNGLPPSAFSGPDNSQFLHSGLQRCALHPQPGGRAAGAADHPPGF